MSSSDDEAAVRGVGFSSECGEHTSSLEVRSTALQGPSPGPEPGAARNGEGEGGDGFLDPECFESEREVTEAGGQVLCGREGRPGSPADDQGDVLQLADESVAAILQQLANLDLLGICRCLSPESYVVGEGSPLWALEERPGSRGVAAQRVGEEAQAEASPLEVGRLEAGRAGGNPKRGSKSRLKVAVDRQRPPSESPAGLLSDSESSDEFSEIELMRVSIYGKDGGQAKLNSPKGPGDTPKHSKVQGRENLLNVPGTCQSSALRGLISVVERQVRQGYAEQGDISPSKKLQSMLKEKGGSLPRYPRVAVASATAAATTGSLPRPSPRRKGVQEKKSLRGVSKPAPGRTFPSWEQGISATPLDPVTFPPVSGIPLLERSKKYALVPSGAKESKQTGARKKSMARRARELVAAMAVSGEDNDPNRDPFPKGRLTTDRAPASCPRVVRQGEPSSTNVNIRGGQDSGNSEPVAMNKGEVMPRGPGPSGDREPTDHPPRPKRRQQPAARQGCPRCLVLQREIDDLKEQLASMQYQVDKFRIL